MKNTIKTIIVLIILVLGGLCLVNAQIPLITGIEEEYTYAGPYVDPTFTDQGYQIGFEVGKVWSWGFASVETSRYENHKGNVAYSDLLGTFGVNFHIKDYTNIRYYAGMRGGAIFRRESFTNRKTFFGLAGGIIGFDVRLTRWTSDCHIWTGPRLWTDYREDQKNRFYGDSDAYERGLITNNPLLQENGAWRIIITW